jgi:hypothetical protein
MKNGFCHNQYPLSRFFRFTTPWSHRTTNPRGLLYVNEDLFNSQSPALRVAVFRGAVLELHKLGFVRTLHELDIGGFPLPLEDGPERMLSILLEAFELRVLKIHAHFCHSMEPEFEGESLVSLSLPRLEELHLQVDDVSTVLIYKILQAPRLRIYIDTNESWSSDATPRQAIMFITSTIDDLRHSGNDFTFKMFVDTVDVHQVEIWGKCDVPNSDVHFRISMSSETSSTQSSFSCLTQLMDSLGASVVTELMIRHDKENCLSGLWNQLASQLTRIHTIQFTFCHYPLPRASFRSYPTGPPFIQADIQRGPYFPKLQEIVINDYTNTTPFVEWLQLRRQRGFPVCCFIVDGRYCDQEV